MGLTLKVGSHKVELLEQQRLDRSPQQPHVAAKDHWQDFVLRAGAHNLLLRLALESQEGAMLSGAQVGCWSPCSLHRVCKSLPASPTGLGPLPSRASPS